MGSSFIEKAKRSLYQGFTQLETIVNSSVSLVNFCWVIISTRFDDVTQLLLAIWFWFLEASPRGHSTLLNSQPGPPNDCLNRVSPVDFYCMTKSPWFSALTLCLLSQLGYSRCLCGMLSVSSLMLSICWVSLIIAIILSLLLAICLNSFIRKRKNV